MTAPAHTACEIFKLLRNEWLSREAIALELHMDMETVRRWCRQLSEHGMLVQREEASGGRKRAVFALSKQWGGCA